MKKKYDEKLTAKMMACPCAFPKLCKKCVEGLESMGFKAQRLQGTPAGRSKGGK
tara:strand:- start:64 stop:225 length:162 start_codon:yes stop_codon:yes gene_type:complete